MTDKRFLVSVAIIFAAGMTGPAAYAVQDHHNDHDGEMHMEAAHVHGAWELFAALDDEESLSVTITGPLVDVLGFEHRPENESEFDAVRALKDRLGSPEEMFELDKRAGCDLNDPAEVIMPSGYLNEPQADEDHEDHEDHDGHDHDDHDDHDDHEGHDHDDHEHDDHEHNEDDDPAKKDGHDSHDHADGAEHDKAEHDIHASNVELVYTFSCNSTSRLKTITATGFSTFPAIEQFDAVFIGDEGQSAHRLEPRANVLKIK